MRFLLALAVLPLLASPAAAQLVVPLTTPDGRVACTQGMTGIGRPPIWQAVADPDGPDGWVLTETAGDPADNKSGGWPDETNTGVPAGERLEPSGMLVISVAGTKITCRLPDIRDLDRALQLQRRDVISGHPVRIHEHLDHAWPRPHDVGPRHLRDSRQVLGEFLRHAA